MAFCRYYRNNTYLRLQLSFLNCSSTLVRSLKPRTMTFLSSGALAMSRSSDWSIPLPIPTATTFVPEPPDVTLFNKVASACNRNVYNYFKRTKLYNSLQKNISRYIWNRKCTIGVHVCNYWEMHENEHGPGSSNMTQSYTVLIMV